IGEDVAALRAMQSTLRQLQGSTLTSAAQFKQLRDAISAKKLEVAQGSQALLKMKGAFDGLGPAAKRAQEAQRAEALAAKLAAKTKADAEKTHKDSLAKLRAEVGLAEPSIGGLRLSTLRAVPAPLAAAAAFVVLVGALALVTAAIGKFG